MSATLIETQLAHPEGSLLARAEAWLGHLVEVPAAALVAGEVVVLLAGVISRFIFNSPIPWADELASILFLWLANLGAAVALRRGSHMRTTALVSRWRAYLNARFGSALVDHHTYAFVGDGCLQEGIGQEMISLAGHLRLGKLVLLWDDNRITDDGSTELSISENVAERFRVADWHVVEVDGHDLEAVSARWPPRSSTPARR